MLVFQCTLVTCVSIQIDFLSMLDSYYTQVHVNLFATGFFSFKQLIPNNLSNLCFFCVQLDITAAEEGLQTEIAADGCL